MAIDAGFFAMDIICNDVLKWFQNSEAVNSRAFTNEAEKTYARAYAMPGALRAGFEC